MITSLRLPPEIVSTPPTDGVSEYISLMREASGVDVVSVVPVRGNRIMVPESPRMTSSVSPASARVVPPKIVSPAAPPTIRSLPSLPLIASMPPKPVSTDSMRVGTPIRSASTVQITTP